MLEIIGACLGLIITACGFIIYRLFKLVESSERYTDSLEKVLNAKISFLEALADKVDEQLEAAKKEVALQKDLVRVLNGEDLEDPETEVDSEVPMHKKKKREVISVTQLDQNPLMLEEFANNFNGFEDPKINS